MNILLPPETAADSPAVKASDVPLPPVSDAIVIRWNPETNQAVAEHDPRQWKSLEMVIAMYEMAIAKAPLTATKPPITPDDEPTIRIRWNDDGKRVDLRYGKQFRSWPFVVACIGMCKRLDEEKRQLMIAGEMQRQAFVQQQRLAGDLAVKQRLAGAKLHV